VDCPDKVSSCPEETTCCLLGDRSYGCCPMPSVSHLALKPITHHTLIFSCQEISAPAGFSCIKTLLALLRLCVVRTTSTAVLGEPPVTWNRAPVCLNTAKLPWLSNSPPHWPRHPYRAPVRDKATHQTLARDVNIDLQQTQWGYIQDEKLHSDRSVMSIHLTCECVRSMPFSQCCALQRLCGLRWWNHVL
jgi:hypothetical protein